MRDNADSRPITPDVSLGLSRPSSVGEKSPCWAAVVKVNDAGLQGSKVWKLGHLEVIADQGQPPWLTVSQSSWTVSHDSVLSSSFTRLPRRLPKVVLPPSYVASGWLTLMSCPGIAWFR